MSTSPEMQRPSESSQTQPAETLAPLAHAGPAVRATIEVDLPEHMIYLNAQDAKKLFALALGRITAADLEDRIDIVVHRDGVAPPDVVRLPAPPPEALAVMDIANAQSAIERTHDAVQRRFSLGDREALVLKGMAEGKTNAHIGRVLNVSEDTVKSHVTRILNKVGAADRANAVAIAYGGFPPEDASFLPQKKRKRR